MAKYSNERARSRQSSTFPGDGDGSASDGTFSGLVSTMYTNRSTFRNVGGVRNRLSMTLKIAVLAPMPSASVRTAMRTNPGDCRELRTAYRRSLITPSIAIMGGPSLHLDRREPVTVRPR